MTDFTTNETTQEIPYGYCHCGCGQKTKIAAQTSTQLGWVKGEPIRFIVGHTRRGRRKPFPIERFWANVAISDPDDCWKWQGGTFVKGYGVFHMDGRQSLTHRISYQLTYGPIPDGLHVCHRCDNPPCCNPAHLFLGTDADNLRDMAKKGRAKGRGQGTKGEDQPQARATNAIANTIRERHRLGERQTDLAREYGLSRYIVYNIIHYRRWKNA